MKKRISYLSGPMTGYPEYNYPTFTRITRHLRATGMEIRSPHECEPEPDTHISEQQLWDNMMVKCMKMMQECNAIILIEGWTNSRGARREFEYAIHHDFDIFFYDEMGDTLIRMSKVKT